MVSNEIKYADTYVYTSSRDPKSSFPSAETSHIYADTYVHNDMPSYLNLVAESELLSW